MLRNRFESRPRYVAIGASDCVGVGARRPHREAWPRLLHERVLAPDFEFVNLGVSGATLSDGLRRQVPRAERLRPSIATVWLVVNDIVRGVPLDAFERDLTEMLQRLRRAGDPQLLVANSPYLDRLPVYLAAAALRPMPGPAEVNAVVDRYNAVIEQVTRSAGGHLVDLREAALETRRAGTEPELISGDGFHPSTAGHRAIAAVFARALRKVSVPAEAGPATPE